MTKLQKACLASFPMSEKQVETIHSNPGEMTAKETIALCLSHERMRAELWGLQSLRKDASLAKRLLVAIGELSTNDAITDTVWLPGNPGKTVCEELASVASALGASDADIESTFRDARQSDHGLSLPIDDDWLHSLLNSYPGRGFVLTDNLSIFNSRGGYRLYAGPNLSNDGDETFPILSLKDRGHVLDLLVALGKLKRHNA